MVYLRTLLPQISVYYVPVYVHNNSDDENLPSLVEDKYDS